MNKDAKYSIKYVEDKTGLNQILLRTWENRYKIVEPSRSSTNRRLYSDNDIKKLTAIRQAIEKGFKISELAEMELDELFKISEETAVSEPYNSDEDHKRIFHALELIKKFDVGNFKKFLDTEKFHLSRKEYILNFLIPLTKAIGDGWSSGDLRIAHEHMASAIIESNFYSMIDTPEDMNAPIIITCTPKGQNHVLMSLAISALLSSKGFRILYLGRSVPADEIISTAKKIKAKAVVMSIIYPEDDYSLFEDLLTIDKYIGDYDVYIGGSSAGNYFSKLLNSNLKYINQIEDLPLL